MKRILDFIYHHTEGIILFIACLVGVAALIVSYKLNLITAYGDAKGHLNIARRVLDNVTPGAAQLGGVWLPLLHILMLPTIWIDFFWHSGLSGSIVSVTAFVASVWFIYKVAYLLYKSKLNASIAPFVFIFNLNLLYMQTTPMTEALFVCTISASTFFLVRWTKTKNIVDLIGGSFFVFLTTINRYEGWSFALGSVIAVFLLAAINEGRKKAESRTIIFSSIAFLGVLAWFIWQYVIFGDPLYFLSSDFSSKGQTLVSVKAGEVPTYHNASVAVKADFFSLVHVLGSLALILAIIGLFIELYHILKMKNVGKQLTFLPHMLLFAPFVFLAYALYNGNVPINVPEVVGSNAGLKYFNIRYALYSLPFIAVAISSLGRNRFCWLIVMLLLIANMWLQIGYGPLKIVTLADAKEAESSHIEPTAKWLKEHYDGGYIIVSAAVADPLIFKTGLPMHSFITEGSGRYWEESRKSPAKYAEYLVRVDSPRDMVGKYILESKINNEFIAVEQLGGFTIYERRKHQR